jgi:arabinose-5-phosphate isomerase
MDETIRQFAGQVIETEAVAVRQMAGAINESFERAVRLILNCRGTVWTSGMGKAGFIARKLAATMSSTGTPSYFLNPGDALHGDVGSLRAGDVVLILSYSGESDEIVRMLNVIKKLGHPVIGLTGSGSPCAGSSGPIRPHPVSRAMPIRIERRRTIPIA